MASIYKNTEIQLALDTGVNLSGADRVEIHYQKPDKTTGEWLGTANDTFVIYNVQEGDLDVVGRWFFQAVAYINGRVNKGEIAYYPVEDPLKLT